MSSPNNPKCDVCRVEKLDTNHWFVCIPSESEFRILAVANTTIRARGDKLDLCGEACIHRAVSQWLAARMENYRERM